MAPDWKTPLFSVVLTASTIGGSAHSEETGARLVREAKELFQLVKTDSPPALERCGVPAAWDTTPIPDYVAHKQFGVTVRAGLSAPTQSSTPAEIMDLGVRAEDVFCLAADEKKYEDEKLSLVKSGQSERETARVTSYSFPVFNASYTKAVVIYTNAAISWTPASIAHGTIEFAVDALVYTKVKGRWHKTATIELAVT